MYDNVIHSPITDDIILVIDELTGQKTRKVGKLLLTCSGRELHNDLIKDANDDGLKSIWNDNKLLISEKVLRLLLPAQLKNFTPKYKQMCDIKIVLSLHNYN